MSGRTHKLARGLVRFAAGRMRRRYPDWAAAMAAEIDHLEPGGSALLWALGCVGAALWTPRALDLLRYLGALALGLALMTLQQWSVDEGLGTCAVLAAVTLLLGWLSPSRFLVSGVGVGLVVAAVHVFGALSGIQPPYESAPHGVLHGLIWLVLIAPAVATAFVGRRLSAQFDT